MTDNYNTLRTPDRPPMTHSAGIEPLIDSPIIGLGLSACLSILSGATGRPSGPVDGRLDARDQAGEAWRSRYVIGPNSARACADLKGLLLRGLTCAWPRTRPRSSGRRCPPYGLSRGRGTRVVWPGAQWEALLAVGRSMRPGPITHGRH